VPPMYMYTTILRVLAKERRSSLQQANNRLDSELHVADVLLLVTGMKAIQQLLTRSNYLQDDSEFFVPLHKDDKMY